DPRCACFAAPGLHSRAALRGGEAVTLVNLSPREPVVKLSLPLLRTEIVFEHRDEIVHRATPPFDTVILDLLAEGDPAPVLVVELLQRAHVAAPRRKRDLVIRVRELVAPASAARAPS